MNIERFRMERWQSCHQNRVEHNLTESGVEHLTLGEFLGEAGGWDSVSEVPLSYGQTNGKEDLRFRIAALYPDVAIDQVVTFNGSVEANFATLWTLLDPGDRVVSVEPAYGQTPSLARNLGADVVPVRLRQERGWQPDASELREAVGPLTKLLIVTNPNNPTGAVLTEESREAVIGVADRVGAWVLVDEVYRGAELNGVETRTLWGTYDRLVVTASLSKAYGLAGLRMGWAVASPEMAETLWSRKDYMSISTGLLTDRLAVLALDPDVRMRLLARGRSKLNEGWTVLRDWLDDAGIFEYRAPEAGAICFVRYGLEIGSLELAERLRTEQSVLVIPGSHFGMDHHLRLGFGHHIGALPAALERIRTTMAGTT